MDTLTGPTSGIVVNGRHCITLYHSLYITVYHRIPASLTLTGPTSGIVVNGRHCITLYHSLYITVYHRRPASLTRQASLPTSLRSLRRRSAAAYMAG